MNGGMYRGNLRPVGLYIENGRELTPANTATLTGAPSQIPNFYKKPNGVFYIGNGEAGVMETGRFLADRPKANFATQSGPMLAIDGAIHPAFIVNSTDRKPRNGVGVSSPTEVHFVITKGWVNFYEFARFFRDGLGCATPCFSTEAWRLGCMRLSSGAMIRRRMAAMDLSSRSWSRAALGRLPHLNSVHITPGLPKTSGSVAVGCAMGVPVIVPCDHSFGWEAPVIHLGRGFFLSHDKCS